LIVLCPYSLLYFFVFVWMQTFNQLKCNRLILSFVKIHSHRKYKSFVTVRLQAALSSSGSSIQKPVINHRAVVDETSTLDQRAGDDETSAVDQRPALDRWAAVEVDRENDADRNTSAMEALGPVEVIR